MRTLTGCLNFRDLGGYPTRGGQLLRRGQLYRSDALHHLSAEEVRHLQEDLRIGDVLDLRSSGEVADEGRGLLQHAPMRFHHVPLFEGDTRSGRERTRDLDLADVYFLMAEIARPAIGRVITILAETEVPAVYHCAAGKDRTGVISAILLGLLDVEDSVIVADYASSAENLEAIIARLMASEGYQRIFAELPPETLHAKPETMVGFLGRMKSRYANLQEYATEAGVTAEALERLRRRMTGPAVEAPTD